LVDSDLIIIKAEAVKKHLKRIDAKCSSITFDQFLVDIDVQESIFFNIQMAIQNCLNIAAHIISDENLGVPGSNNEMFYLLEDNGYIKKPVTEKMVKAVGFRNLIVHEYVKLDMKQVYDITQNEINDLNLYLKAIFLKIGIAE
jgi:uncharacterized protein YutE (UPF0331/DUF86 family)